MKNVEIVVTGIVRWADDPRNPVTAHTEYVSEPTTKPKKKLAAKKTAGRKKEKT